MDTTLNNNIINNTVSRFAIVGVINTLVGTAIMLICYNFFCMSYWWASAMNYSITSILSYFLNKSFTFRYGGNSRKSLLRFTFNIVLCYAIAYGIAKPLNIWLLSGLGKSMCENIALITGTILFIILNFLGQKYYAFNKNDNFQDRMKIKMVSILVPCYNEEEVLPHLYDAVKAIMDSHKQYRWELFFINDGSRDNTMNIIRSLSEVDIRISYVDLSRNFGKEKAMLSGFDYVKGDCMIIMDADLQDPPSLIPEMLNYWEEGYDDVYAKRRDRGQESWIKRKLSLGFYFLLDKATRFEVLKNVGDFRLLDRKCIEALKRLRETERYTKGLFCWIGYKKKEIVFDRADRLYGKTHWSFFQLAGLAIEGFTSFTVAPLRWATFMGVFVAISALLFLTRFLVKALIWGDPVAGFPTLITVILFLGAIQLIAIGVLGEYIGRIFNESKDRPVYLIREYHECSHK